MLYGFDCFALIGTQEIMIIAGVVVLLFGGSKLPELMRGMGQGIREFKSAANEAASLNDKPAPEVKQPTVAATE